MWPGLSVFLQGSASLEPPFISLWVSGPVGDLKCELPSPQNPYESSGMWLWIPRGGPFFLTLAWTKTQT